MKKAAIISLVQTILLFSAFGQIGGSSISGRVLDEKQLAIQNATVSLIKAANSSLLKMALTDSSGKFFFSPLPPDNYFITVSGANLAGYHSSNLQITNVSTGLQLADITLSPTARKLAGVTVSSKKPPIEQKIDRMVVNVDASVSNAGSTALEVLEKSPGISVDKNGSISLKGKSEVLVMIDGKPSYLGGAELANLLSNMAANQLSQIEIMTNPSAKYEAAGNAGVINIKTKKNIARGFNGSASLSYGQGQYAKTSNSLLLNYRTAKTNTFLNYGFSLNKNFVDVDVTRNFLDAAGKKSYELNQLSHVINHSQNNNLKFGLDYFVNPATTLGFVASGFIAPQEQASNTTTEIKDGTGNLQSIEKTNKASSNRWKNGTMNINFHTSFDSAKKDLTVILDYLHYNFAGNQQLSGSSYNAALQPQASYYLKNILPLGIDVYSARIDFTQSFSNRVKLETGIKSSVVKTNNTSLFYTKVNNGEKFQDTMSSGFQYNENIHAAYVNVNKKAGDWTLQAGLRMENTNYKGLQSGYVQQTDSSFHRSYTGLFPTAFIAYQLNQNNQLALSVGRRIDRPAYQQLNPFISFIDKYMRMSGNPYLQPQISNNIEISHSYKNMFTTTLNYSVIKNMINETMTQKDSLIIRSIGNIGNRQNVGITETASIPFTKCYTATFFVNLYKNIYDGVINGFPLKANQAAVAFNINNQFSFSKGWAAELSGTYTSKNRDEGQAISLPIGQVSAGISKQLFSNKASLKLNLKDMFYTQKIHEIQNFQDVQSTLNIKRDTRVFNIAFIYKFGVQAKSKTGQATEEQKRIQLNQN